MNLRQIEERLDVLIEQYEKQEVTSEEIYEELLELNERKAQLIS